MYKDKEVKNVNIFFVNVWRKNIFDIYVTQMSILFLTNKGNNKITELRTILQRESPNS
jgi:hypothetical protein